MKRSLCLAFGFLALALVGRAQGPVTIVEDDTAYTISNGIMTGRVLKKNGDLQSLKFREVEVLTDKSGHAGAYWSHDTTGGKSLEAKITIDPKANGGQRAEVAVKAISGGIKMGHGPGAAAGGDFPADIEIRYTMNRGDSGIYTYCAFEHQPGYPAATMTEARFAAKLAATFDWMAFGPNRNKLFPADLKEGDKYIYTTVQFDNRAFGWASTKDRIGVWMVNPSMEFMSGGPTKVEFLGHRDTTPVAAPIIFNYWRSSHYGGALVEVGETEHWKKVVGPFFIYANAGADPQEMFKDAKARQVKEAAQWPYEWVKGVPYASAKERATVKGKLALTDPQKPNAKTPNLIVGLTAAAYTSPFTPPPGKNGPMQPRQISWQNDAKNYQYWERGDENGNFAIPHVPAGKYTLRALSDGVLGEFAQADVVVQAGKPLDLGTIKWTPVRKGKQLWEVGIPNRNGSEFAGAEEFWVPEMPLRYPKLFPNDVTFVIGKSDVRKDWFFQHVPHNENPAAKSVPFSGITTPGRATPYNIQFDVAAAPKGKVVLRVAISGSGAREVDVSVNGEAVGKINGFTPDGAITRHSIQGIWFEREVAFDAARLKAGTNTLTLTMPAGPVNNGVIYDYLRLEWDENGTVAMGD